MKPFSVEEFERLMNNYHELACNLVAKAMLEYIFQHGGSVENTITSILDSDLDQDEQLKAYALKYGVIEGNAAGVNLRIYKPSVEEMEIPF